MLALESFLLIRSTCRVGLAAFPLDFLHLGPSALLRSSSRLSFSMPVLGGGRPGSPLAAPDSGCLGPLLPMRSLAYLGLLAPVPDSLHLDSTPPLHHFGRISLLLPVAGMLCSEPLAFVLDLAHSAASSALRSFGWPGSFLLVMGKLQLGLSLPLLDFAQAESITLARSAARMAPLPSALDFLHIELTLPMQGFTRTGFLSSASGDIKFPSGFLHENLSVLSRSRFEPFLPVPDWAKFGSVSPLHSSACLGILLSALDFLHMDFLTLPQSPARTGLAASITGISQFSLLLPASDIVALGLALLPRSSVHLEAPLSAADLVHTSPPSVLRGSGHLGLAPSLVDFIKIDPPVPARRSAQLGLAMLVPGMTRFHSSLFVLDLLRPGVSMPLRAHAHTGPVAPVPDSLHLDLPLLLRGPSRPSSLLPILRVAGFGLTLLASDPAEVELMTSLHSRACLGSTAPTMESAFLGLIPLLRNYGRLALTFPACGLSRLEASSLVPDPVQSAPLTSLHSLGCLGSALLLLTVARSGSSLAALDRINLGPLLSSQSPACLGLALFALSSAHLDLVTPMHSFSQLGALTFLPGISHSGFVFSLLVIESGHPGFQPFSRSCLRSSSAVFALCATRLEPSPSPKQSARLDFTSLVMGAARPGALLSVLDPLHLGLALALRSYTHPASILFVPDSGHTSPLLPPKSSARLGLVLPVSGMVRAGSLLLLPDYIAAGLVMFVRNSARVGVFLSTLDSLHMGPSVLPQSFSRPELSAPVAGLSRLDFLFSLSVAASSCLDLLPSLQSVVRLEPVLPAADYVQIAFTLLMRSPSWSDANLITPDLAHFGFSPPSRSHGCVEAATSAWDLYHAEAPLLTRSLGQLGPPASLLGSSCAGPVFSLPVVASAVLGSSLFLQSLSHVAPASSALDSLRSGLTLLLQSAARAEPFPFLPGAGSFLSLRSPCRHDFSFLAPDFLKSDLLMLLQTVHCLDALVFPVGISCLGPVFPLSVAGSSLPGPPPPIHSLARSGSPLSIPDLLSMGSLIPLRCNARAGLTLLMSGLSRFGSVSSPPVASSTTLGPALLTRSPSHVSPVPFVLDSLDSGSVFSLSLVEACSGSPLPVLDFACSAGAAVLLQSYAISGPVPLVFGLGRPSLLAAGPLDDQKIGSTRSLASAIQNWLCPSEALFARMPQPDPLSPVLNFADPGPSLSPRSPAQPDMVALVMDMLQLDTSLLPQSHYQPGSGMLAFGLSRPGSVSLLSVVASANLEPSLSLQSAGRTEALLPVLDFLHLAFPASCRSLTRSSLSFPALRTVDFEFFLPVLDYVQYDPALFVRSFTHLDVFILVPDLLTLGPLLSARMLVRTDSVLPASGKFSFGPSSVSVLNKVFFDLPPSAKSFACLGPVASTPDFLEPVAAVLETLLWPQTAGISAQACRLRLSSSLISASWCF
ncbi:unnamed protein product [Symbiodinium necroappetens]|uniref:Uncharacterized protein n=1 Tax=Symbiodinium necroappetens TaxID=1628268 RepID=A0A812WWN3_9DINO|nr:unnamed protein product [Symbiodinium necroappetens]